MNLSDKIKNEISITDLANRCGYPVQRNGFCFSIYKDEKTPSLKIYENENTFWDFSSGQGGSVIDFYMGAYNVDFATAVNEIAKLYGIDRERSSTPPRTKPVKQRRTKEENIFECMSEIERDLYEERAAIAGEVQAFKEVRLHRIGNNKIIFKELYDYCLKLKWDNASGKYLLQKRNLSMITIMKFALFYIRDYFAVNNHLKKVFDIEDLKRSGLYNDNGNLIFAFHRIVIPYLHKNEIVYLRARYFDKDNNTYTNDNKYLGLRNDALNVNTPKRFFNRDVTLNMKPGEKLYITEGEFDAMILEGLGYNAVAVPGASNLPGDDEFKRLLNFDIVFCPDTDEAGSKLAENLTQKFWHWSKEIKIKQLPKKDVTEFVGEVV